MKRYGLISVVNELKDEEWDFESNNVTILTKISNIDSIIKVYSKMKRKNKNPKERFYLIDFINKKISDIRELTYNAIIGGM